ncbi:MAG: hypothetical protein WBX25_08245 [Rhodomicrobium sp.]
MCEDYSLSIEREEAFGRLLSWPASIRLPLVDVRDIADLHYRAMLAEGIAGERFIGSGDFYWMSEIAGS